MIQPKRILRALPTTKLDRLVYHDAGKTVGNLASRHEKEEIPQYKDTTQRNLPETLRRGREGGERRKRKRGGGKEEETIVIFRENG